MSLVINHNMMAANTARNLNAHYARLGQSAQCLSTGLRVNAAADDAAGLAIRELQRADIATLQQGARNANDAVSMIQTADGALDVIDEKLIRMKELAEQAATGTYDATQRLLIDSEYQTMAAEINRIAKATDFNGIHLLDGSLSSPHDGSGLSASGAVKIHFGTGNSSAEDYYYLQLPSATIGGLGLGRSDTVPLISQQMENGASMAAFPSGIVSFAVIPAGTQNIQLHLYDHGANDTLQIFTRSGRHLAGTALGGGDWGSAGVGSAAAADSLVLTESNGFETGAAYDASGLNGVGGNIPYNATPPYNDFTISGMRFGYSGDGNGSGMLDEYLTIDPVTEDLVVLSVGSGLFSLQGQWDFMPDAISADDPIPIKTQAQAQVALERIDTALASKDQIRARLGAVQNRLENTITNLNIQAENLQAAESHISDVDVGTEMTAFVHQQILTQSAAAMLAQANALPQIAMQLIGG